jgi:hypothetical protein
MGLGDIRFSDFRVDDSSLRLATSLLKAEGLAKRLQALAGSIAQNLGTASR